MKSVARQKIKPCAVGLTEVASSSYIVVKCEQLASKF
jgi:hypothetical protein